MEDTGFNYEQVSYLSSRAYSASTLLKEEARKVFNMDAQKKGPKTQNEAFEAVKAGKLTFKEMPDYLKNEVAVRSDGTLRDCSFLNFIEFVDPDAPKADEDGYKNAIKALDAGFTAAKDVIMGGDYDAGLAAVKAFEKSKLN